MQKTRTKYAPEPGVISRSRSISADMFAYIARFSFKVVSKFQKVDAVTYMGTHGSRSAGFPTTHDTSDPRGTGGDVYVHATASGARRG